MNPLIVLPELNMDHYLATNPSKASWLFALNRHTPLLVSKLSDIQGNSPRLTCTHLLYVVCGAFLLDKLTIDFKNIIINGH